MKQAFFLTTFLLGIAVLAGSVLAAPTCNGNTKVTICHIPPGNPGNAHTITVSECALPAHIGPRGHALDYIGTCERPPSSLSCEQAIGLGLLTGNINGNSAMIQNTANKSFNVSLVSYEMHSANTFDQTIYDSASGSVPKNGNLTLNVNLPTCAYQLDLVCGAPLLPPEYGTLSLDSEFGGGSFCPLNPHSSEPGISADIAVAPFYPQGGDYVFTCNAQNFTPTSFSWYFGDGSYLFNTTLNTTFHSYAPGSYDVACTATNGAQTATDVMNINVIGS